MGHLHARFPLKSEWQNCVCNQQSEPHAFNQLSCTSRKERMLYLEREMGEEMKS